MNGTMVKQSALFESAYHNDEAVCWAIREQAEKTITRLERLSEKGGLSIEQLETFLRALATLR
jgi:hypothetical protein